MYKNRKRSTPSFANINLQGPCNWQCFFCLGKDMGCANKKNYLNIHFKDWKNFDEYLELCHRNNIKKIYLTGQNTDPLLYKYLSELIDYIKNKGFLIGIRTNGVLALEKIKELEKLNDEISFSIHTLNRDTNYKITGSYKTIDLEKIDKKMKKHYRISIVVTRYNKNQILDIIKQLSKYEKLDYIQLRCVATDTRYDDLKKDIIAFNEVCDKIQDKFLATKEFYGAKIYNIDGKEVTLWKIVATAINSYNYFTEGIISDNCFVVEGYLNNINKNGKNIV